MSSTSCTPNLSPVKAFNLEPKKQMETVFVNLLQKCKLMEESNQYCNNCEETLDENCNITKYILYRKHVFCSEYCLIDAEDDIRMSWRRSPLGKTWLLETKLKCIKIK